jgi:hypothetical protein
MLLTLCWRSTPAPPVACAVVLVGPPWPVSPKDTLRPVRSEMGSRCAVSSRATA